MVRNEETLEAITYANRLPDDLSGRQCYVLDPMLATGGTLAAAIRYLVDRGADDITAICLLARPRASSAWRRPSPTCDVPVTLVTGAHRRAAQRERLHRPRPRRRGRPPLRRRLSTVAAPRRPAPRGVAARHGVSLTGASAARLRPPPPSGSIGC